MPTVLLFVEHELNRHEADGALEALAGLGCPDHRPVDVTVLVPCPSRWPVTLTDDLAAAHGGSASQFLADARQDASLARASAHRTLRHVLTTLRRGGHPARGELVAVRGVVHDLVTEATVRAATTTVVVSSPHRLSHLLHLDLEHRLLRAGIARVVRVPSSEAAVGHADLAAPRRADTRPVG